MPEYQLFNALSPEQFVALESDILKRGVMVPVDIDQKGNVLDGHHRVKIAKKHCLQYKTVTHRFKTDAEKREHVIKLNLARRHLQPHEWGKAFKLLLEAKGVKRGKGGDRKSTATVAVDTVQQLSKETGVSERTARHRMAAADAYDKLPAKQKQAVDARKTTVAKAKRRTQKQQRERRAKANLPATTDRYRLICSSLDKVGDQVKAGSVDWIITDPPYSKKHVKLYGTLSRFAKHVLKPGGSLVCMVGQSYLPEVLTNLSESLKYCWTLAYLTPGGQSAQLWDRKVNTFWKPLLWFVKGTYKGEWVGDVCRSDANDNDKRFHDWGQSESGMADIIARFTTVGELICDPFVGGGTTGVAAVRMDRLFIGIDVDSKAIGTTKQRLAEI